MEKLDFANLKAMSIAVLYMIAAIFGMVGGFAAGVQYVVHQKRHSDIVFCAIVYVLAYGLIGMVSAICFLALSSMTGLFVPTTIHMHILFSVAAGFIVSIALLTANATVKIVFQKLGIEVRVTSRRDGEERREPITIELNPERRRNVG